MIWSRHSPRAADVRARAGLHRRRRADARTGYRRQHRALRRRRSGAAAAAAVRGCRRARHPQASRHLAPASPSSSSRIGDFVDLQGAPADVSSRWRLRRVAVDAVRGDEPVRVDGVERHAGRSRRCAVQPAMGRFFTPTMSARRAAGRDDQPRAVADALRLRSAHPLAAAIQLGATRRLVVGVAAARLSLPAQRRRPTSSCRCRCRRRRRRSGSPAGSFGDRTAAGRAVDRSGRGGARRAVAAVRARVSRAEPAGRSTTRSPCATRWSATPSGRCCCCCRGRLRAADRVRERRQPAARAVAGAAAGDGGAARTRRRTRPTGGADAHRRLVLAIAGGVLGVLDRVAGRAGARALVPERRRCPALRDVGLNVPVLAFSLGGVAARRRDVQRRLVHRPDRATQRRGAGVRQRGTSMSARCAARGIVAGGRGDRARGHAAGRRRADAAQLRQPDCGRSRLPHGRRADACRSSCAGGALSDARAHGASTRACSPRSRRCRGRARSAPRQ